MRRDYYESCVKALFRLSFSFHSLFSLTLFAASDAGKTACGRLAGAFCCYPKYIDFCATRMSDTDWAQCCAEHNEARSAQFLGLQLPGRVIRENGRIDCCDFPLLGGYELQYPLQGYDSIEVSEAISRLPWLIQRFREDVEPPLQSLKLDVAVAMNYLNHLLVAWRMGHGHELPDFNRIAISFQATWELAMGGLQSSEFASDGQLWCGACQHVKLPSTSPSDYVKKELSHLQDQLDECVGRLTSWSPPDSMHLIPKIVAELDSLSASIADSLKRGAVIINNAAFLTVASQWGPAPLVEIFAPRGSTWGYKPHVLERLLVESGFVSSRAAPSASVARPEASQAWSLKISYFWKRMSEVPGAFRFSAGAPEGIEGLQSASTFGNRSGSVNSTTVGIFVEFGVAQGHTAEYILTYFKDMLYLGVDPYYKNAEGKDPAVLSVAGRNLARFGDRALLLRMGTVQAGLLVRELGLGKGLFALAYEDGVKTYSSSLIGLQLWFPMLQSSGFFAHDDYMNSDGAIAMWHYAQQHDLLIQLAPHKTMICRSPLK